MGEHNTYNQAQYKKISEITDTNVTFNSVYHIRNKYVIPDGSMHVAILWQHYCGSLKILVLYY